MRSRENLPLSSADRDHPVSKSPRVLHVCEPLLEPTMTFVQQRLAGDTFESHAAGWTIPRDSLKIDVPIHRLRAWGPWGSSRLAHLLSHPISLAARNLSLVRALRSIAPDVVHAHFGTTGLRIHGACRLLGIPLVVSFYGFDVAEVQRTRFQRLRYWRLFKHVTTVTAEGPVLMERLHGLGVPREKLALLLLGVSEDALAAQPRRIEDDAQTLRLIQAARFVEKKGIDTTIRAVAWARERGADVSLLLIGNGPLDVSLRSLAHKLGVEGAVEMPGFVTHDELGEMWGHAHALLQPSRTARNGDTEGGHPTVILEAQAHGLIVLATTHADIPSVVRHRETGLLSAEGDHVALGRHILEIARERGLIHSMGLAARESVLSRHHPTVLLRTKEHLYEEAIQRQNPSRCRRRISGSRSGEMVKREFLPVDDVARDMRMSADYEE